MKLLHIICAALMMVAITSCDEHREFPDTAYYVQTERLCAMKT